MLIDFPIMAWISIIIGLLITVSATNSFGCSSASGIQRVALLELYTSEGCDSCPPVDGWISTLPSKHLSDDQVIPLAFHVDYWNDREWTDRFSQASFSDRQRLLSARRGADFVFTPQLLLNGKNYHRAIFFDDIGSEIKEINRTAPQANIQIEVEPSATSLDSVVTVAITAGTQSRIQAEVFLALSENNLATEVKGGENRGKTLHHDYVVRQLVGPLKPDNEGNLQYRYEFKIDRQWKPQDLRITAFVQEPNGDVLQAISTACRIDQASN
jgi:hypothetical protein